MSKSSDTASIKTASDHLAGWYFSILEKHSNTVS